MRPCLRRNIALGLVLDTVIPYSRSGIQTLGDFLVCHLCQKASFGGMICPDTRQTVSLKLSLNCYAVRARGSRVRLIQYTKKVLHMMSILMSQHICLGERTALSA